MSRKIDVSRIVSDEVQLL